MTREDRNIWPGLTYDDPLAIRAWLASLGFEEGVSLSCDDELNRWQKYAFGCSEMVFQPFRYWFTRGPISKLFTSFLRGKSPLPCKLSSIS